MIAVEQVGKRAGRIRLKHVQDASSEQLGPAVAEAVCPGAEIHTDGWVGYAGLRGAGYTHVVIRESESVGRDPLPLCHRQAGLLKRWLEGTHQGAVSHEHLGYCLDEYTFRFNRRTSKHRGKLFYRLLQNTVVVDPSSYGDIIKGVGGPGRGRTTSGSNLS